MHSAFMCEGDYRKKGGSGEDSFKLIGTQRTPKVVDGAVIRGFAESLDPYGLVGTGQNTEEVWVQTINEE